MDRLRRASTLLDGLGAIALLLVVIATTADVIARWALDAPIAGMISYSEVLLVCIAYLGVVRQQVADGHVSVDLVVSRLPERWDRTATAIGLGFTSVFCLWMGIATTQSAMRSFAVAEARVDLVRVPIWPARVVIPIAVWLLFLTCVTQFVNKLSQRPGTDSTDKPRSTDSQALV